MFGVFKRHLDWLTILPIGYLLGVGYVVLNSITLTARIPIDFSFSVQQIALVFGVIALMAAVYARDVWFRLGLPLYLLTIVLLGLVLIFGDTVGGASRWINVGSFQLQPSELAKLALILVQAKLLTTRAEALESGTPWPVILSAAYLAIPVLLVLAQPDLGTVVIILGAWLAQLAVSSLPKRTLVLVLGLLLLSIPASYPFLADYQQKRIETFFNPSLDTREEGYNVLQATIAVGSGGLYGKGLDAGTQSQLNFLPAQHTDFIYAVIGEKLGFIGAVSVIIAFMVLLGRLSVLSLRSSGLFVRLVGGGVVATLGLQFFINAGMNLGLTPVTGVPLPFVSGGGTHIVTELAMIGVLLGLTHRER